MQDKVLKRQDLKRYDQIELVEEIDVKTLEMKNDL